MATSSQMSNGTVVQLILILILRKLCKGKGETIVCKILLTVAGKNEKMENAMTVSGPRPTHDDDILIKELNS